MCADPRPRHVAWEWGSLRLEAGAGFGILFKQFFQFEQLFEIFQQKKKNESIVKTGRPDIFFWPLMQSFHH